MKLSLVALAVSLVYSACQTPGSQNNQTSSKEIDESNPAGETTVKNETPLSKLPSTDPAPQKNKPASNRVK
jgi:hypothetical protein